MPHTRRAVLGLLLLAGGLAPGSPAQAPGWTELAVPGPTLRHSHAMAYDSARGVTVLFGGLDGGSSNGTPLGDTWEWDGSAWARVATSGPSARIGHALVHDARRGVVVLFGGNDGIAYRNDTWEWDGSHWRQVASTGPRARGRHAMAYDGARGVTVLFGSSTRGGGETWEWDGAVWTQVAGTGPVERSRTALAYDRARRRTVLFGGLDASNKPLGDTWEWDGAVWTQVALSGPAPAARSRHALVYDAARGVSRLYSGNAGPNLRDTWEWDGTAWQQVASAGPPPRMYHALAHQDARGTTLLFGGWDLSKPLADTWEYAPAAPCAMPVAFGCATPHCSGAARLSAATCPAPGNAAFALEVANAVPDQPPPAAGIFFLSHLAIPGASLPCTSPVAQRLCFNVAPLGIDFLVVVDGRGRGSLPLPIPNDPGLSKLRLYVQFASYHPTRDCPCVAGPGLGFTSSQGLEVVIQ